MSLFSSPAERRAEPEPQPDPSTVAARDAARAATDAANRKAGDAARQRFVGRTMGTEGANALFTGTAAGYGRTMGSANI